MTDTRGRTSRTQRPALARALSACACACGCRAADFPQLVRGASGAGALLAVVALLSGATGTAVLYPPLAATCFISATCSCLRVARPKAVIVGHFVASVGGLGGVALGAQLAHGTPFEVAAKLGLAVVFAALLMGLFDADHPPAAATAAIPAILPLPMPAYLLPLNMAWGATVVVVSTLAWRWASARGLTRRGGAAQGGGTPEQDAGHAAGLGLCALGFVLMGGAQDASVALFAGWAFMMFGIAVLVAGPLRLGMFFQRR